MDKNYGRVTIPTDADMIEQTKSMPVKIYSIYYTTRKDNAWAQANPDEVQQVYLMTEFYTAMEEAAPLRIPLMKHFYQEQLKPNTLHDIKRWWEVIDRTTGEVVSPDGWDYEAEQMEVVIHAPKAFHEYTVSFLAFIMWDPVHMYNFITNSWEDVEHQITFDVRQPKTQRHVIEKLKKWLADNPGTDVVRFTTFFHQFTLVFDELAREKFVDWFGYSASVSPYILEQYKEFRDFQKFQQREVAKLMKVLVDICHENGREAMMFLGDHWIGTEPYGDYFKEVGVDAVVGSVGNGATLRLISDIPGVKYTEGRVLPYFFPDVFHEGGDPIQEAKTNWVTARRAILRKPVDRIGYGGYLKLALQFPDFMQYIEDICNEFRLLYDNVGGQQPYSHFTVGVLNSWGKIALMGHAYGGARHSLQADLLLCRRFWKA